MRRVLAGGHDGGHGQRARRRDIPAHGDGFRDRDRVRDGMWSLVVGPGRGGFCDPVVALIDTGWKEGKEGREGGRGWSFFGAVN